MKKFLAKAAVAFLVVGGFGFAGTSAASATESDVCVPSAGYIEDVPDITHPAVTHEVVHPAVYETVEVSPAVEYQPAVYEIEYEFRHKHDGKKTKWSPNPNWNAENNDNSKGWYATGNTRNGELIKAEVPAKDAVTEERLVTAEWVETVIDKEEWIEVTPDIVHPPVECPPTEEPVIIPANPTAVLTASCGEAFLVLTNPLINDAEQLTASFVVEVDGKFYDAYSVEAGNRAEESFTFDEDSGEHNIKVFQAGTSEWKLISSVVVKSDCVVTPPTEESEPETPVEEPKPEVPVVTPPVVETPVVQPAAQVTPSVAAARASETNETLAETGWELDQVLIGIGGLLAMVGYTLFARHRFLKRED